MRSREPKLNLRSVGKFIIDLKQLHKKVFFYRSRVQENISRLQNRLAQVNEPLLRNEILRNIKVYEGLYNSLVKVEALLEVLIIKLETIGFINVTSNDIATVKEVLSKMMSDVREIPDLSIVLEDLVDRANDILDTFPESRSMLLPDVEEARKIISEAEVVAKEKLKETYLGS
jgi:division protein CdvB (Snf7/Vps24/ESCRT-III family)